jgi:4,5-dihydroxyphthalate decarboxylase
MSALPLTTAIANYGHTRALTDGTVRSDRVTLEPIDVSPITRAFRQMVRGLEYDLAEMAFSTYLCARSYQKPITALPLFILRRFEHGQIVYNTRSGIQSPTDLHGRKVGVRSYTLTPGVWTRGILQSAYGVDPKQITWMLIGDEHVQEYAAPSNVKSAPAGSDLTALLLSGKIDAAIGVRDTESPDIQPLIPDSHSAAIDYFQQTGVYPISHIVVVKDALLHANAWLAEELFALFKAAKAHYLSHPDAQDTALRDMQQIIGEDPLPYGVAPNRQTIETFIRFNVEQQIIPHAVEVDDLFPKSVLKLVG